MKKYFKTFLVLTAFLLASFSIWAQTAMTFDSSTQNWLGNLSSAPEIPTNLPDFIKPGTAVYVHLSEPAELEIPDPKLRIRFYHQDHLGSSAVVTDSEGQIVEEMEYYPYGYPRNSFQPRRIIEPYKYTQKELDFESGLEYCEARFYSPVLARFISVDPAGDGLNWYEYCKNNPLKYFDPKGLKSAYLIESKAVLGAGHAGMYVERFDKEGKSIGFSFYEVNDLSKMKNTNGDAAGKISSGDKIDNYRNTGFNATVLSSEKAFGVAGNAGVVKIDFNTKEELDQFLSKSPFDKQVELNTNLEQDRAIYNTAEKNGTKFGNYVIPGNHCGTFAANSLNADGKGVPKNTLLNFSLQMVMCGLLYGTYLNQSPNEIGKNLSIANETDITKINK